MNKSDFMGRECNNHEEWSILYLICAAKGNASEMNYQTDTQGCIIDVKYQYMGAMNMAIVVDECTKATAVQMNNTPVTETPHRHLEENPLEETCLSPNRRTASLHLLATAGLRRRKTPRSVELRLTKHPLFPLMQYMSV